MRLASTNTLAIVLGGLALLAVYTTDRSRTRASIAHLRREQAHLRRDLPPVTEAFSIGRELGRRETPPAAKIRLVAG